MSSSFFEFNIATSAVFTSKTALEVATNNIANAATTGYSRQVANIKASKPLSSLAGVGMVGTGSEVYSISQVRDFYMDKKYWSQAGYNGEYNTKNDQLTLMQTSFNALGDGNLSSLFNDFFNDLSSLSFDSGSASYRTSVTTYGKNLADSLNTLGNSLLQQQSNINDEIYSVVERINDLGKQITTLNHQIYSYEITGSVANELRDQRALLVDELSKYVNVNVKEVAGTSGQPNDLQYVVLVNGQELVNHFTLTNLNCEKRTESMNSDDVVGLYELKWDSGVNLNYNGLTGELKGLIDVRDGNVGMTNDDNDDFKNVNYKGIPYYINKLNGLCRTLARAFNEGKDKNGNEIDGMTGHINGYDANGNQGNLFFSYTIDDAGNTVESMNDFDYDKLTVFNFTLSKELQEDQNRLAASTSNNADEESNNEVILGFVSLKDNKNLFKEGSIGSYVIAMTTSLGIDAKQASNFTEFYKEITTNVDNQRLQISGVSINEEMVDVIRFQQLYGAACRLINAINDIYDKTINQMGV